MLALSVTRKFILSPQDSLQCKNFNCRSYKTQKGNVMHLYGNIVVFLLFQVVASIFFKWGSLSQEKYWWGFLFGNLFGMTSIIMLINVYKILSPAATLAICTGGAFILNQLGLLIIYKQPISISGWGGIGLIFAGILVFAFGAPTTNS